MATPVKTPSGKWRIQIEIAGVREAGTFPSKREANEWAVVRSRELRAAKGSAQAPQGTVKSVGDAVKRYLREVSPTKRGERWEELRLEAMLRDPVFPTRKVLASVQPEDIGAWRDSRLTQVSAGTVLREMVLVTHIFETARREWRWISANPVRDVRRPPKPRHRERVISGVEVRRMLRVMGWSRRSPVDSSTRAVAAAFIAALQTGMRAGELCSLTWADIRRDYCILHAEATKTGEARNVPLTPTARRAIEWLRGRDEHQVFALHVDTLDVLFRRYRKKAGLEGFTFHDTRHTAATNLAPRIPILDLCKMFGWTSTARALTYYNPTASDIARRITAAGATPTPPPR